jgi:magnesium chelatase accessory protein
MNAAARHRRGALDWSIDGPAWPHSATSGFHRAAGMRWHVQQMGEGPTLLLLHGTGASTHSWRTLAPLLSRRFRVVAPDLPGHGFSERGPRQALSLPGMAAAVATLAADLSIRPVAVIGHSAGAAVGIRCCLDGALASDACISINGALLPFRGSAGWLFPTMAKLLFLNPLTPRLLARGAGNRARVERLIRGTGSALDAEGIALYARLFSCPGHVAAALGMMANWDLHRFRRELPELRARLLLITGDRDEAVPPDDAERVARIVPRAQVENLAGLGHLAHEEDAETVGGVILDFLRDGEAAS